MDDQTLTYRLRADGSVARSDGAVIPEDDANGDWRAYRAWVAAGNTPDPALPLGAAELNAPLLARLSEIDARSVRPLRAILAAQAAGGAAQPVDLDTLADLAAQAAEVRGQLV